MNVDQPVCLLSIGSKVTSLLFLKFLSLSFFYYDNKNFFRQHKNF